MKDDNCDIPAAGGNAFWRDTPLDKMTKEQWESLCDGCGKCCLLKLEDADTGEVHYTDISCRLYDPKTCRCGNYALRKQLVPQCVVLTPETVNEVKDWMPRTCAYRLLAEGRDLPEWHPLITGDPDSTRKAGMAMSEGIVPEYEIEEDELADHVIPGVL